VTEVILFDLGGVLVRLTGVPTMLEWTPGNLTEPQLWEKWLHSDAVRNFESGRIGPDAFSETVIREFELSVPPAQFLDAFVTWIDGLFDGVEALLAELQPRFRLATMSNTNAVHWPKLTNEMGLGTLIDTHYPSHQSGLLKPDAAAFEHVVDQLAVPSASILFFDDNDINVTAALDCGLQAATVKGPSEIRDHLVTTGLLTSP
jgi:glucose-1-phosphatase